MKNFIKFRVRNREYLSRKQVVSATKAGSVSLVPFGAYQKAPSFHPLNQHPPINQPKSLQPTSWAD